MMLCVGFIKGIELAKKNMSLNISKGNMYSWVTHTWNTVKGRCPHECSYCYCKRWGKQSKLHLDEKEFKIDLGIGNIIFIGSSCDMFSNIVPEEWICETLNYARRFKNVYLYQSKNPRRMFDYRRMMGDLDRVCTTIETNRFYSDIMKNSPSVNSRAYWLAEFPFNRYLTIEPIMDFDLSEMIKLVKICNPVQVNIGADSGGNGLPEPPKEKILELISELQKFTVIDEKRNLKRLLK